MSAEDFFANVPLIKDATELAANQALISARRKSTDEIYRKNLEAVQNMSFPRQVYEASKHEFGKLGAGIADLADVAVGTTGMLIGNDPMQDAAVKRQFERENEQSQIDQKYQAFSDAAGLPAKVIGGAIPYVISGRGVGPTFVKGAAKALNMADKGVRTAARATGTAGKTVIEKMAESSWPIGSVGRKLEKEFVKPVQEISQRMARQVTPRNPMHEGIASRILGDTVLGAAEGGLHYDNTMGEGAIAGGAGAVAGQAIKPYLHRIPSFYGEPKQELIEWGKKQGFQFLPGMETGHRGYQMFENDLRTSNKWADFIYQNDVANGYIANRVAFEQLGIPEKTMKEMNPKLLREHLDNMGKEYDTLVKGTVGWLKPSEVQQARDTIQTTLKSVEDMPKKHITLVTKYTNDFDKLVNGGLPIRNPLTGKMQSYTYNGTDYQKFRSKLKNEIDTAYVKGDKNLADSLKPLLTFADRGIENGMAAKGGEVGVAAWKDANEKYAISKLIINHGMSMDGMLDAKKLGRYFMSTDPERFLTEGAGPRMNNLYRLAKLQDMSDKQASGGLFSGAEDPDLIHNPTKQTVTQRLLQTPAGAIPGLRTLYGNMYRRGYPAQYGLLGLTGEGLYDAPLYTRALAQSSQIHPKAVETLKEGYDYLTGLSGKIGNAIRLDDKVKADDFFNQF